jgi:hypothetical protein
MGLLQIDCFDLSVVVFWVAALCSLAEGYEHFGGMCHLHLQGGLL